MTSLYLPPSPLASILGQISMVGGIEGKKMRGDRVLSEYFDDNYDWKIATVGRICEHRI